MNLTPEHLVELVLYRHYSDKYTYASVTSTSGVLDQLICEGLVTVLGQPHPPAADVVISERGRQALAEVGSAVVFNTLHEVGKPHLFALCDNLTLADLPILLTSSNERIRVLARKIYQEWN